MRARLERFRPQFDPESPEPHVFLNATGRRMTLRSLEEMIGPLASWSCPHSCTRH
jgi:hypothetical protein